MGAKCECDQKVPTKVTALNALSWFTTPICSHTRVAEVVAQVLLRESLYIIVYILRYGVIIFPNTHLWQIIQKKENMEMAVKLKVNNSKSSMPQQLTKMFIFQTVHHRQVMWQRKRWSGGIKCTEKFICDKERKY